LPCWLTDSGRFTHKVVTRPAVSLAQDTESLPAMTGRLTTILRHQLPDASAARHFSTTLRHRIAEKSRHFGQFRRDTAPPVIRLKLGAQIVTSDPGPNCPTLRHQFCGAEVSCGRSARLPDRHINQRLFIGINFIVFDYLISRVSNDIPRN